MIYGIIIFISHYFINSFSENVPEYCDCVAKAKESKIIDGTISEYKSACVNGYTSLINSDCIYYDDSLETKIAVNETRNDCMKSAAGMNDILNNFMIPETTIQATLPSGSEIPSDKQSFFVSAKLGFFLFKMALKFHLNKNIWV